MEGQLIYLAFSHLPLEPSTFFVLKKLPRETAAATRLLRVGYFDSGVRIYVAKISRSMAYKRRGFVWNNSDMETSINKQLEKL